MKTTLRSLAVLAALLSFTGTIFAQTIAGWTQTFSDEFSGSSLDTSKWNTTYMWDGKAARTLEGNSELEVYWDDQFEFSNGKLRIRADQETSVWYGTTYNYSSGMIASYQKFAQTYGYFEARVRLPSGKGLWPAFWMVLNRKTWPPEIDIFEVLGQTPCVVSTAAFTTGTGSYHHLEVPEVDTSTAMHVFGLEWDTTYLTYYVDGRQIAQTTRAADMIEPMQLILNLAVGGWPGAPDASTVFPAYMDIDYVRAWTRTSSTAAVPYMLGQDIGSPGVAGSANLLKTGTSTITGSGTGYQNSGTSDSFHYTSRQQDGDGEIVVKITAKSPATNAQAGLMFRESLAVDAPYAAVYLTNGGCVFQTRASAAAAAVKATSIAGPLPSWLMLRRQGQKFTAFQSADGVVWTVVGGANVALSTDVRVGVAVSGGTTSTVNTVSLTDLERPVKFELDNTSASGVTIDGAWSSSTSTTGYVGSNYIHDGNTDKGSPKSVTYAPTLPSTATYAVQLNWVGFANRAPSVPVTVNFATSSTSFSANQQVLKSWVNLGLYQFNAGSGGNIVVSNAGTSGYVTADAIRFTATGSDNTIVDNSTPTGVTVTGSWTASSSTSGYYNSNYLHDGNTDKGSKSVRFSPTLPAAGTYAVYLRWTSDTNRATNVPISIVHAGGTANTTVNQQASGGTWVLLGTYTFDPAGTPSVLVSNTGTNGTVIADAVRFEAVTLPAP